MSNTSEAFLDHTSPSRDWTPSTWALILTTLTLATLCTHGYHPLAEDGGLYVAGIEYTLDPTLFPHYTEFVREHLRFSVFSPTLAIIVRTTHLSLAWTLLLADLLSIATTLYASLRILRHAIPDQPAVQLSGIALLAAWWTLPVAGTSLMLMDPYVTARSLSTPISLLAISFVLNRTTTPRKVSACAVCLLAAAAFHPLMAAYALAFILVLEASKPHRPPRTRIIFWIALAVAALILAAILQHLAPPESPALQAAAITRYYWFLSQWQWFEILGLAGPPAMFSLLLIFRRTQLSESTITLCHTTLALSAIAVLTALLFAHESTPTHLVARLQVLRVYLLMYAIMALLLGATLAQLCHQRFRHLPAFILVAMALLMAFVQRQTFPASQHLELPWRAAANPNPWVQAFLWAKSNTPPDALFALDAKYVNESGEDAQTFRATALRSAIPDYSKDGGEASIAPALAPEWQRASAAQKGLSQQSDSTRDANLRPFAVTWIVLHSTATTAHTCPYNNGTIKVCQLTP